MSCNCWIYRTGAKVGKINAFRIAIAPSVFSLFHERKHAAQHGIVLFFISNLATATADRWWIRREIDRQFAPSPTLPLIIFTVICKNWDNIENNLCWNKYLSPFWPQIRYLIGPILNESEYLVWNLLGQL